MHDHSEVDDLPNVFVALDDADETNGCLSVIRGSHLAGCLPGRSDGEQLSGFFTDPNCFDLNAAVPLVMAAGSVAFFSPHIVHGSAINSSDAARRALIYTYQAGQGPALKSGVSRPVRMRVGMGQR